MEVAGWIEGIDVFVFCFNHTVSFNMHSILSMKMPDFSEY